MEKIDKVKLAAALDDPSAEESGTGTASDRERQYMAEIQQLRDDIRASANNSFSRDFTNRVMEQVIATAVTSRSLFADELAASFKPLLVLAASVAFLLFALDTGIAGYFSVSRFFGIPEYTIDNIAYLVR